MPLQTASVPVESRGSKLKKALARVGSIFLILVVVFSCMIPMFEASAATSLDGDKYKSRRDSIYSKILDVEATESKNGEYAVMDIMGGAYNSKECKYTISVNTMLEDDSNNVSDNAGAAWERICEIFTKRFDALDGSVPGILSWTGWNDAQQQGILLMEFEAWFPGFSVNYTERNISGIITYFSYFDVIQGVSGTRIDVDENASEEEIIEAIINLGADHDFKFSTGTTIGAIVDDAGAAFKALLVGGVSSSFAGAINSVTKASSSTQDLLTRNLDGSKNYNISEIGNGNVGSGTVTRTGIYSANQTIYDSLYDVFKTVMLPVAGVILAFIFAYEIYEKVVERNNMNEIGTGDFIQLIIKMCILILVVLYAWVLVEWVFDLGAWMVNQTVATLDSSSNGGSMIQSVNDWLEAHGEWGWINADSGTWGDEDYILIPDKDCYTEDNILTWVIAYEICINPTIEFGDTLVLLVEGLIINIGMFVLSIIIYILVYVRLIEMYIHMCVAPIPLATITNRTWQQTGLNFIRSIAALALQGFIIYLCLAIFNVLISTELQSGLVSGDITGTMWEIIAYALILVFCLFKSGSLSKSILGAH